MSEFIVLTRTSDFTGKQNKMQLPISEEVFYQCHQKWREGMFIQNAFPMLNADECEFIKTGVIPEEWDRVFKSRRD